LASGKADSSARRYGTKLKHAAAATPGIRDFENPVANPHAGTAPSLHVHGRRRPFFIHPFLEINKMANTDGDDDVARLRRHCKAIEAELDAVWLLFGLQPPARVDGGGTNVRATRDSSGRRVFDRGAA
jgi:hypothetical protein